MTEAASETSAPQDQPGTKPRKFERTQVAVGAFLRPLGYPKAGVDLLDVSPTGCRVETYMAFSERDNVWLTLPIIAPVHARIVWSSGSTVGCEFVQPLHPAVFDMVLGKLVRH